MFGYSNEAWAAIGSTGQALVSLVLILIAVWQLRSIKRENLKSRTLSACDRYDTDPILDLSIREVTAYAKKHAREDDWTVIQIQIATILNYLDSIAVGIEQGLYIEGLARDHLKPIAIKHYDQYLGDESFARRIGLNPDDYDALRSLVGKWKQKTPIYRDGWKIWRKS